jgi:hypothetical protein
MNGTSYCPEVNRRVFAGKTRKTPQVLAGVKIEFQARCCSIWDRIVETGIVSLGDAVAQSPVAPQLSPIKAKYPPKKFSQVYTYK